jgi:hypothetical protein
MLHRIHCKRPGWRRAWPSVGPSADPGGVPRRRGAGCQPATVPELPVEDQRSAWMSEIWENLWKSMGIIWFIDFIGIFYGKSNHDISWMGNLRKWINYDQIILNFKEWRTIFHILAGLTKITNQPSRWKWVVQAGNDGNFVELGIHMDKITSTAIWGFPKMGVPQNWGKIPNKNGWWLGVPLWLRKPPYRRGWVHLDIDRQRAEVVLRTLNSGY